MFPGEHFDDFLLPFSQPRTTTMSFMFKSKGKFLDNVPCDPGRGMNRLLIVGLLLFLTGCGSSDTTTTPTTPIPPVGGAWEITAKSGPQVGYSTLIEANLQQTAATGTTETATITATGDDQLVLIGQHPSGGFYFGGLCPGATVEDISGTLSTSNSLLLTLTEGGAVYTLTGTANNSGQSMLGTYAFTSGSCRDSGTFSGVQVPALAGTYGGVLNLTNGNSDNATATLTEGDPSSFTVNLILTGDDNTTITLTGFVVGNLFSVQGTLNGQAVSYYGYYSVIQKAVYMLDATTDAQIGTLFAQ
jgi:hypothetical protein